MAFLDLPSICTRPPNGPALSGIQNNPNGASEATIALGACSMYHPSHHDTLCFPSFLLSFPIRGHDVNSSLAVLGRQIQAEHHPPAAPQPLYEAPEKNYLQFFVASKNDSQNWTQKENETRSWRKILIADLFCDFIILWFLMLHPPPQSLAARPWKPGSRSQAKLLASLASHEALIQSGLVPPERWQFSGSESTTNHNKQYFTHCEANFLAIP